MKFGLDWKTDRKPTAGEKSLFGDPAKFRRGIYQLDKGVWAWMQPNGSWGESNAGIISDEDQTLVFDSLYDLKLTQNLLSEIQPIVQHAPIKTLVNSHANADHTYGNQLFHGAEILASERCKAEMPHEDPASAAMMPKVGFAISCCGLGGAPLWPLRHFDKVGKYFQGICQPYSFKNITLTLPTKTFNKEYKGQIGNIPFTLIEVGPAHTDGDIILYLPEQKILFAGDILFIEGLPAAWNPGITNWIAALELIEALDVETIVPGHGPIVDKSGVDEVKGFFQLLLERTEDMYRNGKNPYQIAEHLMKSDPDYRPYLLWDSPERTVMATTTYTRVLDNNMEHYSSLDKFKVLWNVANLAYEFPKAEPKILHTWKR